MAAVTRLQTSRLFNPKITPPRQAWVETFIGQNSRLLDIVELNPRIFGVFPRIDHVSDTVKWQKSYRNINYITMPTRNELPGGIVRPWPQKGTGRARHASVNSPIFLKGGWARGPRGPTTMFRDKPLHHLSNTMRSMLTVKLAQNDIRIVDKIKDYANEDPKILEQQLEERGWGPSALIVDDESNFTRELYKSTRSLYHVNLMSIVGLNALSLCKHETLIITLDALRKVEEKLLFQLLRIDLCNTYPEYRKPQLPD